MIALFDGSCENNSTTCQRRGLNSFIFVMTAVKVLLKSLCEMHCLRSVFEQIVTGESCALVVRLGRASCFDEQNYSVGFSLNVGSSIAVGDVGREGLAYQSSVME